MKSLLTTLTVIVIAFFGLLKLNEYKENKHDKQMMQFAKCMAKSQEINEKINSLRDKDGLYHSPPGDPLMKDYSCD